MYFLLLMKQTAAGGPKREVRGTGRWVWLSVREEKKHLHTCYFFLMLNLVKSSSINVRSKKMFGPEV